MVVLLISVISLILVTERSLLSFLKKAVDFFTVEGYEEDIEERLAKKKRKQKRCPKRIKKQHRERTIDAYSGFAIWKTETITGISNAAYGTRRENKTNTDTEGF